MTDLLSQLGMGYFDFGILAFAAFLLLFVLIKGCMRGGIRAFLRLLIVAGCAAFAYFGAQMVIDNVMALEITVITDTASSAGVDLGIEATGTVQEYLMSVLSEQLGSSMAGILEVDAIQSLIVALPSAIVAEVFLLLAFIILKPVSLLVFWILKIFVPKRGKDGKKLKRSKLAGIFFSLIQAVVVLTVFLIPTFGLMNIADQAIDEVYNTSFVQEDPEIKSTVDMVKDILDEAKAGKVYPILESSGIRTQLVDLFNHIYKAELNPGEGEVYIMEEVVGLLPIAGDALDSVSVLSKFEDPSSLGEGDLAALADLLKNAGDSKILTGVLSGVISSAAKDLADGKEFMGFSLAAKSDDNPNGLDPVIAEGLQEFMSVLASADSASLSDDIAVLGNIVGIIDEAGILSNLGGETPDIGALLGAMSEKKEGADKTVAEEVIAALGESEHFTALIPIGMNIAIGSVADTLGIPKDKEAVYDNMLDTAADALNEDGATEFDYADVDQAIIAAAMQVRLTGKAYAAMYLDGGTKSAYDKYMTMYDGLVSSMKSAGLGIADSDHLYTTQSEVLYILVNGKWQLYSAYVNSLTPEEQTAAAAKKAQAEALASLVVETAAAFNEVKTSTPAPGEEAKTAAEMLQSALTSAVTKVVENIADESLKKSVSAVSDKETFKEESKAATAEDLKFDVSNFSADDVSSLGSMVSDVVKIAADVLPAISGGEGAGEGADPLALVSKIDIAAIGGVIAKMDTLGGKEGFASSFIGAVADSPVIAENEDLAAVKDTLKKVAESEDTDFEDIFNTVGALTKFTKILEADADGKVDPIAGLQALTLDDWKDFLYTVGTSNSLTILTDTLDGFLDMAAGSADKDVIDNVRAMVDKLLGTIKAQNYQTAADAENDAKAIQDMFALVADVTNIMNQKTGSEAEQIAELKDSLHGHVEVILESGFVTDFLSAVLKDFGTTVLAGKSYFGVPELSLDLFVCEKCKGGAGENVVKGLMKCFSLETAETLKDDLQSIIDFILGAAIVNPEADCFAAGITEAVTSGIIDSEDFGAKILEDFGDRATFADLVSAIKAARK